jgi:hypothetical protein
MTTTKLQKYESNKPSGVEWLGETRNVETRHALSNCLIGGLSNSVIVLV